MSRYERLVVPRVLIRVKDGDHSSYRVDVFSGEVFSDSGRLVKKNNLKAEVLGSGQSTIGYTVIINGVRFFGVEYTEEAGELE